MSIRINQVPYQPIQKQVANPVKTVDSFETRIAAQSLKISNHAQKRMDQRGFTLAENDLTQLNSAVDELQEKGSKNSLLLYKDLALIANIHNRTIITALDREEVDTITNIDSTKFVKE